MGGNALKNTETRRFDRAEYLVLSAEILDRLRRLFPLARVAEIPSYASKPDFGDMDVVLCSGTLPSNWVERVLAEFTPNELVSNGNIKSFDVAGLQVDLIVVPEAEFDFTLAYFAYNDLGNLMGRVAHKLGFKYGHAGLVYVFRDSPPGAPSQTDPTFREILISRDLPAVFAYLGYDHDRYLEGFEDLESIFDYTVSTPYFNKSIFLLENRNSISRRRDSKRRTYNAFLKWLDTCGREFPEYRFPENKADNLASAFRAFPGFEREFRRAEADLERRRAFRSRFNGDVLGEVSGLSGQALGEFIAAFRKSFGDEETLVSRVLESDEGFVAQQAASFLAEYQPHAGVC